MRDPRLIGVMRRESERARGRCERQEAADEEGGRMRGTSEDTWRGDEGERAKGRRAKVSASKCYKSVTAMLKCVEQCYS